MLSKRGFNRIRLPTIKNVQSADAPLETLRQLKSNPPTPPVANLRAFIFVLNLSEMGAGGGGGGGGGLVSTSEPPPAAALIGVLSTF